MFDRLTPNPFKTSMTSSIISIYLVSKFRTELKFLVRYDGICRNAKDITF